MGRFTDDAWGILGKYIDVIHGKYAPETFIGKHLEGDFSPWDVNRIALILRAQFERQKIFTSCGWFFDEFERIEPGNNIKYAAQAVWYTRLATGKDLTPLAVRILREVKSDRSGLSAEQIFQNHMKRLLETGDQIPSFSAARS
jgi:hypothetical protein